jgi:hypothetical protein
MKISRLTQAIRYALYRHRVQAHHYAVSLYL